MRQNGVYTGTSFTPVLRIKLNYGSISKTLYARTRRMHWVVRNPVVRKTEKQTVESCDFKD